jgi:hypothetical protein
MFVETLVVSQIAEHEPPLGATYPSCHTQASTGAALRRRSHPSTLSAANIAMRSPDLASFSSGHHSTREQEFTLTLEVAGPLRRKGLRPVVPSSLLSYSS